MPVQGGLPIQGTVIASRRPFTPPFAQLQAPAQVQDQSKANKLVYDRQLRAYFDPSS